MRLQKIIKLDDARSVLLRELRVRDARNIMAQAKELEKADIKELITNRFDEVAALLGDCIQMPEGEAIDDLSFSEVNQVVDGLMEVNSAFLGLLGPAGLAQAIPSPTSTGPAPPSSSGGIQE